MGKCRVGFSTLLFDMYRPTSEWISATPSNECNVTVLTALPSNCNTFRDEKNLGMQADTFGQNCVKVTEGSVGRNSVGGIATSYRLNGSGVESRGGEIFCARPDLPWGSPSLLCGGYRVSFSGVARPWRDIDHPPHPAPRFKKEWSYTSTPLLGLRGLL